MHKYALNFAIITVAAATTSHAHAGPAYQELKRCLNDGLLQTEKCTWDRFTWGLDCLADYLDTKTSVSFSFEGTDGVTHHGDDAALLNLEGLEPALNLRFEFSDPVSPIESVTFRLFEADADPLGVVLDVVSGPGEHFETMDLDISGFGLDGWIAAEVKYVGVADIDDVGLLYYSSLYLDPPCRPDIDGDGVLDIFDFLGFQNLFDAGDLAADFDGDGVLDIFDFLAFGNEFDAGCP